MPRHLWCKLQSTYICTPYYPFRAGERTVSLFLFNKYLISYIINYYRLSGSLSNLILFIDFQGIIGLRFYTTKNYSCGIANCKFINWVKVEQSLKLSKATTTKSFHRFTWCLISLIVFKILNVNSEQFLFVTPSYNQQ